MPRLSLASDVLAAANDELVGGISRGKDGRISVRSGSFSKLRVDMDADHWSPLGD